MNGVLNLYTRTSVSNPPKNRNSLEFEHEEGANLLIGTNVTEAIKDDVFGFLREVYGANSQLVYGDKTKHGALRVTGNALPLTRDNLKGALHKEGAECRLYVSVVEPSDASSASSSSSSSSNTCLPLFLSLKKGALRRHVFKLGRIACTKVRDLTRIWWRAIM